MSEVNATPEIPQNKAIYINNLNEKIKIDGMLLKSLNTVFTQFREILEVLAFKTLKHKGQAWVFFEDASSASNVVRQMQGFPFYDKLMITVFHTVVDIIRLFFKPSMFHELLRAIVIGILTLLSGFK
ncbi:hypothetical protein JHK82_016331 [Glycine max]|nr:hypothetical protein JHK85_016743 [Glycine max]KAG5149450.1 hypothetical protein JHK82_016331 [Glycine max]